MTYYYMFSLNSQTRHCHSHAQLKSTWSKNKNNDWTHSAFHCLFEINMFIPVLWNIYTFTCTKSTFRERLFFQCQRAEFRKKETLFFWIKYCEKWLERLFRRSKLQNFLRLPTMVANRIFRYIPTDRPEFQMTAEKWNYLITMTAGIQNVISSAGYSKYCFAAYIWHSLIERINI